MMLLWGVMDFKNRRSREYRLGLTVLVRRIVIGGMWNWFMAWLTPSEMLRRTGTVLPQILPRVNRSLV